ncbi:putative reverse transcriptase-7 [Operophtera brumata]|uniref:Putative reverse transcriptase-7 n=1 Tax=Operophtera brumata TaxID=104452 RepID=A0A0L7LSL2_OPEBR|nr:putative reverse transcriptase-7 [Operophtera brumata]
MFGLLDYSEKVIGRRVHDLTLLTVDSEHCVINDDHVILWPIFGSKTDNSDYRQSGWKLLKNQRSKNLDPVFWINNCEKLLRDRRKTAKCTNLFLHLRGQAKAASRTVIASWVKSALAEAGIIASPGSIRSAVASKNWADNVPVDEILSRGNWRSGNTFRQFYRREVIPVTAHSSVTSAFVPCD